MKNTDREFKNFIYNLCKLRKLHKLPKCKMAKILGISVNTLNKIESGQFPERLGVEVLFRVWDYFGVEPKDQLKSKL